MKKKSEAGYNERLFSGDLRGQLHRSRFRWLRESARRVNAPCRDVLELGCFDGRSIAHLPHRPSTYLGLDANWEGGVDLGRSLWRDDPGVRFEICSTPLELRAFVAGRRFDTTLSLETLEHVAPDLLDSYVEEMAKVTTGWFIATVPNEKGPVFLAKYAMKRLFGDYFHYRPSEVLAAFLGRMDRVRRDDHKGFDYDTVVRLIGEHFDLVEVSPYPFRRLPKWTGFGIGIVAKARAVSPSAVGSGTAALTPETGAPAR
ncbi:MAG TPA: class I SAM-dependent methyltransferase [Candidatus Eisenbacteria bacterium]|nr:class I SAM-dependent methyltransferase [Candidatus Eisenbacteria bacterium]